MRGILGEGIAQFDVGLFIMLHLQSPDSDKPPIEDENVMNYCGKVLLIFIIISKFFCKENNMALPSFYSPMGQYHVFVTNY